METIAPLDIGFAPNAEVSGAILFESEFSTFLIFNARRRQSDGNVESRLAIVEFDSCSITKFGYPNDEARYAIPHTRDLGYDIYEVRDSGWIAELAELNRHAFPDMDVFLGQRHFMFLFHDSSFECVARSFSASLTEEPLSDILARLSARIVSE